MKNVSHHAITSTAGSLRPLPVATAVFAVYLIEANCSAAIDLIQRTECAQMGNARFGELPAKHAARPEAWRRTAMGEA